MDQIRIIQLLLVLNKWSSSNSFQSQKEKGIKKIIGENTVRRKGILEIDAGYCMRNPLV